MSCHNYPDKSVYGIIRDNGQAGNQCDNGGNLGDVCRLKCDTITSGGRDPKNSLEKLYSATNIRVELTRGTLTYSKRSILSRLSVQ